MKTFRDLLVWQKSIELVVEIYKVTKRFPNDECYGLTSQMRRCAVSIPSNMAEGYGRNSPNDFARFLQISTGSLFELQTQIEISHKLNYVTSNDFDALYESTREIERMLSSFIRKVQEPQT
ncbi:MAG: four helix bundle protein [Candidatus Latescibacter sp.]|nr:four helix bundle protein [Candidatus Latescibacter sp.]